MWAAGITAAVLFAHVIGAFERLENATADLRFSARGVREPHPDITLISIDEFSLKEIGMYPWARRVQARLVDLLKKAGARAIAFDVLFLEKDDREPDSDAALGRALSQNDRVVLGAVIEAMDAEQPLKMAAPIPALRSAGIGYVNVFPEIDGTVRSGALWNNRNVSGDGPLASLAFAATAKALDKSTTELADTWRAQTAGPWHDALINFTGWSDETKNPSPFPYHSYARVLSGDVPAATFKNKIVIVGGTAIGLFDTQAVPNNRNFPGPEIHANIIDNLLTGSFLRGTPAWGLLLLTLGLAALGGGAAQRRARTGAMWAVFTVVGYWVLAQALFNTQRFLLPVVTPLAAFLLVYVASMVRRLMAEEYERRRIKDMFGQYVSPTVIEMLIRDPARMKLGGEERHVTLFFSDIAGFTSISERLPPQQLVTVLNEYLSRMTDEILKLNGTLDKFIGDAIMAFWNAPVDQPGHAALACRAALAQRSLLPEIHKKFADLGWPLIDFRVGLNTGPAIIGNMGSVTRRNYTAVGDTVNLASRLEGANKSYGTRLLISESTREAAKNNIEARELDFLQVVGKKQPIRIFELLAVKNGLSPEKRRSVAAFEEGLALYRAQRFPQATAAFMATIAADPADNVAPIFVRRCEQFQRDPPPPDWDGVYVMIKK